MKKIRSYNQLIKTIKSKVKSIKSIEMIPYAKIKEINKPYTLYRIQPKNLNPKALVMIITAGFHGEEPQGPLTISKYLPLILQEAKSKNIQLIIYPCINPSGWEYNKRYNLSGEDPNNYFIYYQLSNKKNASEISPKIKYKKFIEIDKTSKKKLLPKESKALINDIRKILKIVKPKAVLDIHQDNEIPKIKNSFYIRTTSPNKKPLVQIIKKTSKIAAIVKNTYLGEDVNHTIDIPKNDFNIKTPAIIQKKLKSSWFTDKNGIMFLNDGSITDFLYRRGVKITIAIESDTNMPSKKTEKISLIWIKSLINIISKQ